MKFLAAIADKVTVLKSIVIALKCKNLVMKIVDVYNVKILLSKKKKIKLNKILKSTNSIDLFALV